MFFSEFELLEMGQFMSQGFHKADSSVTSCKTNPTTEVDLSFEYLHFMSAVGDHSSHKLQILFAIIRT